MGERRVGEQFGVFHEKESATKCLAGVVTTRNLRMQVMVSRLVTGRPSCRLRLQLENELELGEQRLGMENE